MLRYNRPEKVLCLSPKIWWWLFSVFCIFLAILKLIPFFLPLWMHQGKDEQYWEGDLYSVTHSGGIIDEISYLDLSHQICYFNNSYDPANINLSQEELSSLCEQFELVSTGISASIAFTTLSFLNFVAFLITFIYAWEYTCMRTAALVSSILGFCCELMALSIFAGVTQLTFGNNCRYFSSHENI